MRCIDGLCGDPACWYCSRRRNEEIDLYDDEDEDAHTENVAMRRAASESHPVAGSGVCDATTTARMDRRDDGKWRRCERPAGHNGNHETTYCGRPYRWPNTPEQARAGSASPGSAGSDARCPTCRQRNSVAGEREMDDGSVIVWYCNVPGCSNSADHPNGGVDRPTMAGKEAGQ